MTVQTSIRHWKRHPALQGRLRRGVGRLSLAARQRLTTVADFEQVLNLTDEQRADLEACMGKFRVSVTPYYARSWTPTIRTIRCACRPCPRRPSCSCAPKT